MTSRPVHPIPNPVLTISPVQSHPQPGARGHSLPLSLIAQVISYVEDVADIARMTRTCRLMYYMTLPVLYERVALRAYSELRYVDGRLEGYGSGSPFAMALDGLATGNAAGLVKELTVTGSWSEPRADEYNKGKIPDSTILLGIAMRAAIDKMTHLRSFTWGLDIKPTKSMYHGLAARTSLTSLDIRFPKNRAPRPIVTIPPIPNIRRLRFSDIDPLCYPDDMSILLLNAKKLEDLRVHWSPRMREEAEPSINLRTMFGKCLEASFKLPVKHIGLQNFYGANTGDLANIFDMAQARSVDFIEVFGGAHSGPTTIWVDDTWRNIPEPSYFRNIKRMRISELGDQHAKIMSCFSGLEEIYLLGVQSLRRYDFGTPISPGSVGTPATNHSSPSESSSMTLCREYLHSIATMHGHTLKNLLLSDLWPLSSNQVSELVKACPNLEQLGLATADDAGKAMELLIPFMIRLRALRILPSESLRKAITEDPKLVRLLDIKEPSFWKMNNMTLQWAGIGDRVIKIGKAVRMPDEDGRMEWGREIAMATLDDVRNIEIWKLDALEL